MKKIFMVSEAGCSCIDNGAAYNYPCRMDIGGSTTATLYKTYDGGGFTTSGNKGIRCSFTYESQ